ncbi:MAG TPA: NAD-binding protein [Symbiobacteriaceae bacterium]|nr:NAD-binding protein [Symbiobacteriaceae bacterium]
MHVILVGCGRVGASLATALAADEHDVVVVDKNPDTFANLGAAFNGVTVTGTGIDIEVLRRAGIEQAHAFAAVTSHDNVNLMASQIARKIFHVPKVVARINDHRKRDAYQDFEVETICPTDLGASYLRRMLETRGMEILRTVGAGQVAMVRFIVPPALAGRTVADVELPEKLRVSAVERGGMALVAEANTRLHAGDQLLVAARRDALDYLQNLALEVDRP